MPTENSAREIELVHLLRVFLNHKRVIATLCVAGAILLFAFSYMVPVMYKSSTTLVPVENNDEFDTQNLVGGSIGNLADLAGINLGNKSSSTIINIEIIKSRQFILDFVKTHALTKDLVAANGWNRDNNTVQYDQDIFSIEQQRWLIEDKNNEGQFRSPSDFEIYEAFMKNYTVTLNTETGLIKMSFKHVSPYISQLWLNKLVDFANQKIRESALLESEKKMEYLKEKMKNTRIESIRSIFFQLIENELQSKMLIDTRQKFAYKIIDPPFLPEEKFTPNRLYYLVLGGLFTFIIIFVTILFSLIANSYKDSASTR